VLEANLACLQGQLGTAVDTWQAALADEPRIDRLGQGIETRVRLAAALLRMARFDDAARWLAPVFPRLAQHGGEGVLALSRELLPLLAAAPWGDRLDAGDRNQLRTWADRFSPCPAAQDAAAGAALPTRTSGLSERELAVLERIALGDSNKLIARAFDLSPHTVKRHVANILDKLGVDSRGQAAAWYRAR
jgi:LuxR family maltose regulon positive regulatory protein